MANSNPVPNLYKSVISDVVAGVREAFLDEGVDEQVLQELKQLWETKLNTSKAVENLVDPAEGQQMGMYAQHELTHTKQEIPQRTSVVQPTAVVQQSSTQQPAAAATQVQLPVFNAATGQLEISGAAAQAHTALSGLVPGNTVMLQTPNGPMQFIIQAQPQAQGTVTLPAGVVANSQGLGQVDGQNDSSSDDDDDDDDDDNDDDDQNDDENEDGEGEEEEPLNSGDDVSDDDPADLFDTDNVVVCQFDKINRAKNRWKFHLKDGIMNLNGRDLVFQKCNGDAEW